VHAYSAVRAGDATAFPSKFGYIWAKVVQNLFKFGQNMLGQ